MNIRYSLHEDELLDIGTPGDNEKVLLKLQFDFEYIPRLEA